MSSKPDVFTQRVEASATDNSVQLSTAAFANQSYLCCRLVLMMCIVPNIRYFVKRSTDYEHLCSAIRARRTVLKSVRNSRLSSATGTVWYKKCS